MINKKDTFEKQSNEKRRPRISFSQLYPQIKDYCSLIFDGTLDNLFD